MRLRDLTVEVRDKHLNRVGIVRPEELVLELEDHFNNVGTWKLTLAAEHPLATELRSPGAGVIITGPVDILMSGPATKSEYASTPTDPGGSIVFEGISDTHILSDYLSFPDPTNIDPTTQTLSHDVRTGAVESIMHEYVHANAGPGAPQSRRHPYLLMGADAGRGPVVTKSPRFPVLGELLTELATLAGLGFRVVQRDSFLYFETYQVTDRSAYVRLDVLNNTLSGAKVAVTPATATRVIVAGQGEMTDRQFREVTTEESLASEELWGRRIEVFKDQRNTNEEGELDDSGLEILRDRGFTSVAAQAVPMEDSEVQFGIDWGMGDRVSVIVEGQELTSTVTGMALKADADGFRVGALLGDPSGFDVDATYSQRIRSTEARVSALERNEGQGATYAANEQVLNIMGVW